MSKKQKRRASQSIKPATKSAASPAIPANVSQPARTPASISQQARARTSTIFEFKPDYTYIFRDLRRISILAGSFFVILIVLSFFLR